VTVVNDEQRALLAHGGVDHLADAPATGTMNTVFTLNTHIGTHIDAPRHFFADGGSVDELPLEWGGGGAAVMRDVGWCVDVGRLQARPARGVTGPTIGGAHRRSKSSRGRVAGDQERLWTNQRRGQARVLGPTPFISRRA
jgi:hypothetical protein